MRRGLVVAAAAGLLVTLVGAPAAAHALLRRSDPAAGALLQQAPPRVVLTFTEPPDPSLSLIHVLDENGRDVEKGGVQPVAGSRLQLQVALPSLPDGVYTVTWRTVSQTDGHVTAGSFAFGVGVAPPSTSTTSAAAPTTPSPSVLAAVGRWGLYWGLALLLAAAVLGLVAFGGQVPASRWLLGVAWLLAAVGLLAMTVAERSTVGVSYGALFRSSAGRELVRQGIGLAVVGIAVALVLWRAGRTTLIVLVVAAAFAMLLHALAGHAASASPEWFSVGVQWLHLLAVGVWVGGLVWVLLGTRKPEARERVAVSRFSFLAGIALATVAVTGLIRAAQEVGGIGEWRRLFDTSFGTALVVKVALFFGLVALGAWNRYVNVPGVRDGRTGMRSLHRTIGAEVVLAAGILGVTGVLTQLPPAAQVAAAESASVHQVVVAGSDFATTVRVRLVITPGTVGPDRFEAHLSDYDTGAPFAASGLSLRFSMPSRPELGTPSLDLSRVGPGTWTGQGTVLSLPGSWDVSVLIQQPAGSLVVPLHIQVQPPPEHIQVSRAPGQPTVYTIALTGGISLQTYVDPGKTGNNTVHFTFFQASGDEQPIATATATSTMHSGHFEDLSLIRFDPGHFGANVTLDAGRWRFTIQATTREGVPLSAYFDQTIQP
jgi:copper transport protein